MFNHIEQPTGSLQDRLSLLTENMQTIRYVGERREQVSREIACIAFELGERYREAQGISIEQAYIDM